MNIQTIRKMHEEYLGFECAMLGGTGASLGTHDYTSYENFKEWLVDGFGSLLDEMERNQNEINSLRNMEGAPPNETN